MEKSTAWWLLVLFFVIGAISMIVSLTAQSQGLKDVASYILYGAIAVIILLGVALYFSAENRERLLSGE